jgi:hypothetical protein
MVCCCAWIWAESFDVVESSWALTLPEHAEQIQGPTGVAAYMLGYCKPVITGAGGQHFSNCLLWYPDDARRSDQAPSRAFNYYQHDCTSYHRAILDINLISCLKPDNYPVIVCAFYILTSLPILPQDNLGNFFQFSNLVMYCVPTQACLSVGCASVWLAHVADFAMAVSTNNSTTGGELGKETIYIFAARFHFICRIMLT